MNSCSVRMVHSVIGYGVLLTVQQATRVHLKQKGSNATDRKKKYIRLNSESKYTNKYYNYRADSMTLFIKQWV